MPPTWTRLIRFIATDGRTLRGEPILPTPDFDVGTTTEETKLQARVIEVAEGGIFDEETRVSEEVVTVRRLLGPLEEREVPIIRCIGLNFIRHIKEGGRTLPPFPTSFIKATTCLQDHGAPVIIPKIAQNDQADYEGELCFVVSKDAKNVPLSEAPGYIGAYTSGNDISSRKLQRDPTLAGTVPQWNFSKGFDTYCPLGPQLISSTLIPPSSVPSLYLTTTVNGEKRQGESMSDLCFKVPYLLSYLSQGTTLKRGTVVMTGTPAGVGYAMKGERGPQFLRAGDVVEVRVWPHIGTLRNPVEYEEGGLVVPPQGEE